LNRSAKSGCLCLVFDFKGKAVSFSPWAMMLTKGLAYVASIMLKLFSFHSYFVDCFEWVLNFIKWLFCSYWNDHVILILCSVNIMYNIDWFHRLNYLCILRKKTPLGVSVRFFQCVVNSLC
jgi:hypothetical protein